jgi:tetratricopeptide (TPR) repeat protein
MKPWIAMIAVALVAVSGAAQEKTKDKEKDKKQAPAKVVSPDALMKEAEAKATAGDVDGAAELLQKAAAVAGASGEPSLRLGRLREGKAELDLAIDAYQAAAAKLEGAPKGEALGRLAVLQATRGMTAEATASAQAAATADPEGVWPTIALSRLRAREGKGDEAVALAQKASAAGGGLAATTALAYAQEARGDLAAAEAAAREALAKEPQSVAAAICLARVLRKTGRAAEALPLLQKALETAPGAIEAYKESARVRLAMGRPDDALADANMAAAMAERDPDAQSLALEVKTAKALEAVRQGQVDTAIRDLTALRDQNPEAGTVRVGLAKAFVAKRQADAALAELAKAVELDPKLAEAHYQVGFVQHAMKNNSAAAVAAYEKAVALEPADAAYRTHLGAALVGAKQFDRALEELNKVTALPGYDRPDAWIYIGQAQVGAKKYKEAIPPLEKAISIAPENDQAHAFLAWAYFGLKDVANFKKAAGKAKSLGHKEPTLLQYLSRVEAGEPIK